ncbi:PAS domain-containing protein [Cognatilysobacter terrigena]|uniref:PAS domain-containing protein n=1 Tax=Cognatilysobacter terrigena TaxID=2488749 RepID=UPI001414DE9E|nr:PAS domain-containing protein [Lysobacter terrigena]
MPATSNDIHSQVLAHLTHGGGSGTDDTVFRQAVMAARDGVVIARVVPGAPEHPIIFANPAFERLTGYSSDEILGRDCRFLQGDDHDQAGIDELRRAIDRGDSCLVVLRNYRKDGSMFWNELSLAPMRGPDGRVWRYVGIQKDVSNRMT